ncbi:hypothetical protein [Paenibacillus sp. FSL H3-0333]|uniref:hypothetical protein n=1 Tax=Paenibacillus sp. FSL H3-0333 TaxID=2921373 RepID=UPI0030FBC769
MRRDWTRLTLLNLLKAVFLPVLLLIFLITALQMLHEQEPEMHSVRPDRYEHKLAQPVRVHHTQIYDTQAVRLAPRENPLTLESGPPGLLLCVSLLPFIYILLKRLLLIPLKYNSHFVGVRLYAE